MGKIRIGLTIAGAVSLGAFEGGALAALLAGVQAVQAKTPGAENPLRVDAIGAASAGSITAVAVARILTAGLEPVWVMEQAWVQQDSLDALLKDEGLDAPLSMKGLDAMAQSILQPPADKVHGDRAQKAPITIDLALTNLRGLDYLIDRISASSQRGSLRASTYLDWGRFTVDSSSQLVDFVGPVEKSAVDTGLASGASELGFPPKRLVRSEADYSGSGLVNFPAAVNPGFFWYTDGGTVNNEPLGRTLDVSNQIDLLDPMVDHDCRLHILIHPFPSDPPPSTSAAWADGGNQPTWLRTLLRAATIVRAQHLYDDMRQAEKTNSRIIWKDRLAAGLKALITTTVPTDQRDLWVKGLQAFVHGVEEDLANVSRHRTTTQDLAGAQTDEAIWGLIDAVLDRVTNLAGKNAIAVEVVSPYLAIGTRGLALDQILAGEFLASFGGFFHEGLRRSDFALGFVCMLNWLETGLTDHGLDPETAQIAVDAALEAFYGLGTWEERGVTKGFTGYGLSTGLQDRAKALRLQAGDSWMVTDFGELTMGQLPLREQLQFARVAGRVGTVLSHDLWRHAIKSDVQ